MMAGSGMPGDRVLPAQVEAIETAGGSCPAEAAKHAAKERRFLILIETEQDQAALQNRLKGEMKEDVPEAQIETQIGEVTSPWLRHFLTYDPATAPREVTSPVLAIIGEKDTQVPPKPNLPPIRQGLKAGGNRHFEVVALPGLNHLFQAAKTGAPAEYAQIEETMSPVAMDKIAGWSANLWLPTTTITDHNLSEVQPHGGVQAGFLGCAHQHGG
jgi:pimeloyl-ACP methyl ester carboxylesterase